MWTVLTKPQVSIYMTGQSHTKQLSGEPNQPSWDNIIMLL